MIDFACRKFNLDEIVKCALGLSKADYKILRFMMDECEKPFTSEMLSMKISLELSTVQRSLKRLHEKGVIIRHQENLKGGGYIFIYQTKKEKAMHMHIREVIREWSDRVDKEIERW